MKTYPYHTPEGIIQLVEKRELDQLLERLAEARESHLAASARDVQTIQRQAILLERLANDLRGLADMPEYDQDDAHRLRHIASKALATYESANPEPVARLIAAAPDLLEALIELRNFYIQMTGLPPVAANAAIAKAKGEQL